ncbi:hypothetical protein ANO14919_053460 [Xylariales sp. No.14919]|nr:hypothetical protein ANO14919_053460 [Xylariales sp. No.14919]
MDGGVQQQEYSRDLKGSIKQRRRKSSHHNESPSALQVSTGSLSTPKSPSPTAEHVPSVGFGFSSPNYASPRSDAQLASSSLEIQCSSSAISVGLPTALETWSSVDWLAGEPWSLTPPPLSDNLFEIWSASSSTACPTTAQSPAPLTAELVTSPESENPFLQVKMSDWSAISHYLHNVWYRIFPFICRSREETLKERLLKLLGQSSMVYHTIMAVAKYSIIRTRDGEARVGYRANRAKENEWLGHYNLAASKYQNGVRVACTKNRSQLEEMTVCLANLIILQHVLGASIDSSHQHLTDLEQVLVERIDIQRVVENTPKPPDTSFQADDLLMRSFLEWIAQWVILYEDFDSFPAVHSSWMAQRTVLTAGSTSPIGTTCSQQMLESISEIHRLARWKRLEVKAERLSAKELSRKAHDIELKLLTSEALSEPEPPIPKKIPTCYNLSHLGRGQWNQCEHHVILAANTGALFQQAALIYMYTILSGTRPRVREIKASVAKAVRLLKACSEAQLLEYVAWPLCVTGCMMGCETDDEREARHWLSKTLESLSWCSHGIPKHLGIWSAIQRSWRVLDGAGAGANEYDVWEMIKQFGVIISDLA